MTARKGSSKLTVSSVPKVHGAPLKMDQEKTFTVVPPPPTAEQQAAAGDALGSPGSPLASEAFFFAAADARNRAEWVAAVSKSARKTPGLNGAESSLHEGDEQEEDEAVRPWDAPEDLTQWLAEAKTECQAKLADEKLNYLWSTDLSLGGDGDEGGGTAASSKDTNNRPPMISAGVDLGPVEMSLVLVFELTTNGEGDSE
eukprot:SAG22_NODE_7605_length_725_cov_0.634185_2_plen_199_part_01